MADAEQELRRELRDERERLAEEVAALRERLAEATDVRGRIRAHLPVAAAGALGLGFVAAGGLRATARLLLRRR